MKKEESNYGREEDVNGVVCAAATARRYSGRMHQSISEARSKDNAVALRKNCTDSSCIRYGG